MKRRLLVASAFLLSLSPFVNGQEVMDAYKLSQTELTGTARSMSMGGAFGALGGDVSAIAINPAGIGVYKSSEIVTTLNFQNIETKTSGPTRAGVDTKKFNVNFNNLAFVTSFPLYSDVVPAFNIGFSYNRLQSFDRKYSTAFGDMNRSMADYITDRTNRIGLSESQIKNGGWEDTDWLALVGYEGFLINPSANGKDFKPTIPGMDIANMMRVREKGSVNSYDFNMGMTIDDILSVGMTVAVTDLDYRMSSYYFEDVYSGDNMGSFDLVNDQKTEGTGWQLGLGVIFKPVDELRIGVAYHSPTWYNMTQYSSVYFEHGFHDIIQDMNVPSDIKADYDKKPSGFGTDAGGRYDYKMRTPDKWVFSLAGVLGGNAILSLDYELIDYKKTKYNERDSYYSGNGFDPVNEDIKAQHRLSSTLRLGGEYRFTPQFSGRVGYQWQQSPYEDLDPGKIIHTAGSVTHYIHSGDKQYITWGLGYRFTKNFYTDVAFVYRTQDSDLYFFNTAEKIDLKENSFQGALTLGFRF